MAESISRYEFKRFLALCVRPGVAWLLLTFALGVHVADEAAHDFLSFYNPIVRSARERWALFPMPTFSFDGWLAGLILGIVLLLAVSPFAFRRAAWVRPFGFALSVLMIVNGAGHLAASLYLGTVVPGTLSAPLLLVAAGCLLVGVTRGWKAPAGPSPQRP